MTSPRRHEATPEEVRALAHPVRLRVLRELWAGERTNNELAARLGRDKATVLHHVRVLVDAGFVEALPPRPGPRGSRERPYRSTGKSFWLSVGPDAGVDEAMRLAYLEEVAGARAQLEHGRLVLRLDEAELAGLTDRLQAVLDEYAARAPTPGGRQVALYLSVYEPGETNTQNG